MDMGVKMYSRALGALLLAMGMSGAGAQTAEQMRQMNELGWVTTPARGVVADKAEIALDGGLRFLGSSDTNKFMSLTGNLPSDDSFLLAAPDLAWFAVLDFTADGYVKDDEKIDADELLRVMKEGNVRSQEERKKRGLPLLVLDGWYIAPRYDTENKRLEWATLLHSQSGGQTVNYTTKVLGRTGHTTAILVSDPASLDADIKTFKAALRKFDYRPGERYAEFKAGDKVAEYGLAALIVGGAAAVATKKGLWTVIAGFFAAFWKIIAGVAVAGFAALRSLFKKAS
jgi:uncharacterized membrane-anchored protein